MRSVVQARFSLLASVLLAGLFLGLNTADGDWASPDSLRVESAKQITVSGQVRAEEDSMPVGEATVTVYRLFGDSALGTATSTPDGDYQFRFALPDDVTLPHRFRVEAAADGFAREQALIRPDTAVVEPVDFALVNAGPDRTPIAISNVEQLRKIGESAKYPLDGDYVLTQDIDASQSARWNDGRGFDPIGEDREPADSLDRFFSGTLDGQGHEITGLVIDRPEQSRLGLFAGVEGGTIRDLALRELAVTGETRVGGLAGTSHSFSTFENCRVEGSVSAWYEVGGLIGVSTYTEYLSGEVDVTVGPPKEGEPNQKYTGAYSPATGGRVGGIAGQAGFSLIQDFRADIEVPSGHVLESVGGLAGASSHEIRHSHASGSLELYFGLEGSYNSLAVGGLVGANSGRIFSSSASVDVQGSTVGGLVGNNENGTIEQSHASGTVQAPSSNVAGGLVGMDISGEIRSSYATGDVTGEGKVGGIVGRSRAGRIQSSFAGGTISSEDAASAGGLLGDDLGGTEIVASYWNREKSGQDEPVGEAFRSRSAGSQKHPPRGLSTGQMTGEEARTNLDGLDFETVWRVGAEAYPSLRWESQ